MKRFIVLTVLAVAFALLLSGTAMAYTDYIPYLSKGTTGAVRAGAANTDNFGTAQNEAPAGMPNTYDAYALGCFWCHGWEKRQSPNSTNVVDLQKVITSPSIRLETSDLPAGSTPASLAALMPDRFGSIAGGIYVGTLFIPSTTVLSTLDGAVVQGLGGVVGSDPQGLLSTATDNVAGSTLVGPVAGSRWTNLAEQYGQPYGAHGGYSNTTDRCKVCHDVHAAAGSKRLTAGNAAEDICETCHDFTQGISIYGAIEQATGVRPAGGHRVKDLWEGDQTTDTAMTPGYDGVTPNPNPDVTPDPVDYLISGGSASNNGSYNISGTLIPGYLPGTDNQVVGGTQLDYPQTGGVYLYTSASLASRENQLTCSDCHTPHGNTSMRPFKGDRVRLGTSIAVAATLIQPLNINTITLSFATVTAITPALGAHDGHLFTGTVAGLVAVLGTLPQVDTDGDLVNDAYLLPLSGGTAGYLVDVLQAVGIVPWGTAAELAYPGVGGLDDDLFVDDGDGIAELNEGLKLSPSTAWGQTYISMGITHMPFSGLALAVQLYLAGALRVAIGVDGLTAAVITNATSNKLLRDYVNQLDLRSPIFGGALPGSNGAPAPNFTTNGGNNYDQTLEAPLFSGGGVDPSLILDTTTTNAANDGNPYNNGQMGATAEYGSGFCAACHRGRIGNFAGLVEVAEAASLNAARLDNDFINIKYPMVAGSVVPATFSDTTTCTNHPTLMKLAYRNVGELNPATYNPLGSFGNPGTYTREGLYGLALSNAGFTFWPVNAVTTDGDLGDAEWARPKAPICQQCHEDSRDVETAFLAGDTDKVVPFNGPVNLALGLATGLNGALAMTQPRVTTPLIGDVEIPFIQSGNPLFQNFPHETQNYRLLVEGGDSNQVGGGSNDDLCLNCHVPGSTVRPGDDSGVIIFTNLVKDFNGFQE